jgi:hypothetical protein
MFDHEDWRRQKIRKLNETSMSFSSEDANVLSEGVGNWMQMVFSGHSQNEMSEIEDDIKDMKSEGDRQGVLRRIDGYIDHVQDAQDTAAGMVTWKGIGVFLGGWFVALIGSVAFSMLRNHNVTQAQASGILDRVMGELKELRNRAKDKDLSAHGGKKPEPHKEEKEEHDGKEDHHEE